MAPMLWPTIVIRSFPGSRAKALVRTGSGSGQGSAAGVIGWPVVQLSSHWKKREKPPAPRG